MSKVTTNQDQLGEVDQIYRRLSAQDAGRPGEWVRRKVQAYAAQQAAERAVRANAKSMEGAAAPAAASASRLAPTPRVAPVAAMEEKLAPPAGKPWLIPAIIGGVAVAAVAGFFVVPALMDGGGTS